MKITGRETFVVSRGFTPPRPWRFCAIRTDAGLTGYSEFGSDGITRGLVGLVQDLGRRLKIPAAPGWGTELNEKAAKENAWTGSRRPQEEGAGRGAWTARSSPIW